MNIPERDLQQRRGGNGGNGAERKKFCVDEKDLIAFLCKLNSILIASTVVCYTGGEGEEGKKSFLSLAPRRVEQKLLASFSFSAPRPPPVCHFLPLTLLPLYHNEQRERLFEVFRPPFASLYPFFVRRSALKVKLKLTELLCLHCVAFFFVLCCSFSCENDYGSGGLATIFFLSFIEKAL
jgi:hypothetical protein